MNHVDLLSTFCSWGIRQKLVSRQFANGKLFKCGGIDRRMALLSDNDDALLRRETTCLYCSGKSRNAVAYDDNIRAIKRCAYRFILITHRSTQFYGSVGCQ